MSRTFTQADLESYLDEALTPTETAELEEELRSDADLLGRLRAIIGRRDAGVHSLGEIWRRHRVSCPDREMLGSFLLKILEPAQQEYIEFHLKQVGCRYCQANLDDLQQRQSKQTQDDSQTRRHRYFQSSAGYLKK